MIMHDYAYLRFCHERGKIKRWEAVRHVIVSGTPVRVFFIFMFSQKTVFRRLGVSCFVDVFFTKKENDPEVSGRLLGPSPTYSGPILYHFVQKLPTKIILGQFL